MKSLSFLNTFFEKNLVKGFLAEEEGLALYGRAIEAVGLGPCLEIGSYCGKSSVYLGQACKDASSTLFSVDHHRGSEEHQVGEEYYDSDLFDQHLEQIDSFPLFQKTIRLAELQDHVVPIVVSSQILAKVWAQKLGLVFVDGGHSEEQALHDVLEWAEHVCVNGYMLIHDIYESPEYGGQAPRNAMLALLAQPGWKHIEQVHSLAILKRLV